MLDLSFGILYYMTHSQLWHSSIDRASSLLLERIIPATGFYHFQQDQYNGVSPVVVPMVENFKAVLLLLRTRDHEKISKAKVLLERLLAFSIEEGDELSFPRDLHEYPVSAHPMLLVEMLSSLVQIQLDFPILGHQLIEKLQVVNKRLCSYLQKWFIEKEAHPGYTLLFMLLEVLLKRRTEESFLKKAREEQWLDRSYIEHLSLTTHLVVLLERTFGSSELFDLLFSKLFSLYNSQWKKTAAWGFAIAQLKNTQVSSLFEFYLAFRLNEPLSLSYVDPFFLDIALVEPQSFHYQPKSVPFELPLEYKHFCFANLDVKASLSRPKSNERFGFTHIRLQSEHLSPVIFFPRGWLVDIVQEDRSLLCTIESEEEALHEEQMVQLFVETSASLFSIRSPLTLLPLSYQKGSDGVIVSFDGVKFCMKLLTDSVSAWSLLRGNRPGQLEKKSVEGKIGFDWLISGYTTSKRSRQYKLKLEVVS